MYFAVNEVANSLPARRPFERAIFIDRVIPHYLSKPGKGIKEIARENNLFSNEVVIVEQKLLDKVAKAIDKYAKRRNLQEPTRKSTIAEVFRPQHEKPKSEKPKPEIVAPEPVPAPATPAAQSRPEPKPKLTRQAKPKHGEVVRVERAEEVVELEIPLHIHDINDDLFRRYIISKKQNKEIESELAETNYPLIYKTINNLKKTGLPLAGDEMESLGGFGLLKAIRNFNPEKAVSAHNGQRIHFASYAMRVMQNEIFMFMRKQKTINEREIYEGEFEKTDKDGSVGGADSIDAAIYEKATCDYNTAEDIAVRNEEIKQAKSLVQSVVNRASQMGDRKKAIFARCVLPVYFDQKTETHRNVGKDIGISQSYVSRIEKTIREDLAKHVTATTPTGGM